MKLIPLGGRYFTATEHTTARQDAWMLVQAGDAGLGNVGKVDDPTQTEAHVQSLTLSAFRSGKMFHLLAGALVEVDGNQPNKWTEAEAEKNAEFFAEMTDAESKATIFNSFVEILLPFFLTALPSLPDSPSASVVAQKKRRPRRPGARSTKAVPVGVGAL